MRKPRRFEPEPISLLGSLSFTAFDVRFKKRKPSADTLERFYSLDSSFALPLEGANVFNDLASIVEESRSAAIRAVNVTLLRRNHLLGKRISEEILNEYVDDIEDADDIEYIDIDDVEDLEDAEEQKEK